MSTREAFIAALHAEEPRIENWALSNIADDLEGCTESVSDDRGVIAHYLWAHGVTADHIGECRADEERSIYENECAPCQEQLLALADRVLWRLARVAGER